MSKNAREKQVRRRMHVLQYNFGFEKPYKVLCDGNFLQAALEVKMFLKEELPKVMSAPCNPMVSNCIREELRRIGDDVSGASLIAKRFTCIRCTCQKKEARTCIEQIIGEKNGEKYIVATQDMKLRRRLREIPGVPILFISYGKVVMESLSEVTTATAKKMELEKCRPAARESKMLGKRLREEKAEDRLPKEAGEGGGEAVEDAGAEEAIPEQEAPQPFSKKKKKGPKGVNPLAMKKPSKAKGAGGDQKKKKKKRQHRKRKSGIAVGGDGGGD